MPWTQDWRIVRKVGPWTNTIAHNRSAAFPLAQGVTVGSCACCAHEPKASRGPTNTTCTTCVSVGMLHQQFRGWLLAYHEGGLHSTKFFQQCQWQICFSPKANSWKLLINVPGVNMWNWMNVRQSVAGKNMHPVLSFPGCTNFGKTSVVPLNAVLESRDILVTCVFSWAAKLLGASMKLPQPPSHILTSVSGARLLPLLYVSDGPVRVKLTVKRLSIVW